jgi:Ca2+-binding EF-hand superfamily protein
MPRFTLATAFALLGLVSMNALAADKPAEPAKPAHAERNAAAFKALDTNSDGFLSKDEFNVGKTGDELTASQAEFDKLDTDKDGKLTKKEFVTKKHKPEEKK